MLIVVMLSVMAPMLGGAATLIIMTLSIVTLSIMAFRITIN